jgi:DNA topoisomerase I
MPRPSVGNLQAESESVAKAAGLHYVHNDDPGYRRQRRGPGFRYLDQHGRTIRNPGVLKRIASLAIPPAWTSVWICADERGHLQATGLDARGRKQYRYHPDWRAVRDITKYDRLVQFAAALPRLRRKIQRLLRQPGLPRDKVLAAVIRLLDIAGLRVGNDAYANVNGSFGLTTLRTRHLQVTGTRLRLRFRGKGGFTQDVEIDDARLTRIVRRCSELPGQRLFQYLDDQGQEHTLGSVDVNAAIQEWTHGDFTAKDFRTWAGTVNFLRAVDDGTPGTLRTVIEQVAKSLGNTPAVCRKHYIHPLLIEQFTTGRLRHRRRSRVTVPRGLNGVEQRLLQLLTEASAGRRPRNGFRLSSPAKLETGANLSGQQKSRSRIAVVRRKPGARGAQAAKRRGGGKS